MRTRAEFIARWRTHVCGVIAIGSAKGRKLLTGQIESTAEAGQVMFNLTDTTDELLGKLFDDLVPPPPLPAKPQVNGAAKPVERTTK